MKWITALLAICALPAFCGAGLATVSEGGIQFAIDTALFDVGLGETLLLEVYQEVEIGQFARDESGNTTYTTEVALENAQGDTLAWDIWNTPVTWSEGGTAVNSSMLPVSAGDWILTVTMTDVMNGRTGSAVREFTVEGIDHFSEIELARTIMPAAEGSASALLKGNLIVYPAASTSFTVPGECMIYTYQEIYSMEGTDLERQGMILDATGTPVFAGSAREIAIPEGAGSVALVDSFDISVIREPGLYSVSVIYTADEDTVFTVNKPMFIDVDFSQTGQEAPEVSHSGERYLEEFQVLLSNEDLELWERLDTEARELYYDNYWAARAGEHSLFADRCGLVGTRYGSLGRQGWQSDMGRVYLKYGEPDEVEANPFSTAQAPYEVWYFYGNEQEMFVFADLMGNGDMLQIHSTVEGEVSYANWQDMLQNINQGSSLSGDDEDGF